MELDRDRRAVVQKHEIENKVADVSFIEEILRSDFDRVDMVKGNNNQERFASCIL